MASFLEDAVRLTGEGFDTERGLLMPRDSWVALLGRGRRDVEGEVFRQLRLYRKGFITRSNNFRTGFYVEIATLEDLALDILKTTHFALGSGNQPGKCYAVSEGDTFPPSGDRFSWMIYGSFVKDVYELPV
jgi:hypothetical protein